MNEVEKYIEQFPNNVKESLYKIRNLIFELAPDAEEKMAYGMPAYHFNKKPLVYYAAFKNHIGLYALPVTNVKFKNELLSYKCGKGSIQFPINEPIPYNFIERIVLFRVKETGSKKKIKN